MGTELYRRHWNGMKTAVENCRFGAVMPNDTRTARYCCETWMLRTNDMANMHIAAAGLGRLLADNMKCLGLLVSVPVNLFDIMGHASELVCCQYSPNKPPSVTDVRAETMDEQIPTAFSQSARSQLGDRQCRQSRRSCSRFLFEG